MVAALLAVGGLLCPFNDCGDLIVALDHKLTERTMTHKTRTVETTSGIQDAPAIDAHHDDAKISYIKPELYCHGDIRDLTMGGSPGMGESGGFMTVQQI